MMNDLMGRCEVSAGFSAFAASFQNLTPQSTSRLARVLSGERPTGERTNAFAFAFFTLLILYWLPFAAQDPPKQPNEQFIPADQLDTIFDRDRRGVMMQRNEFKALLEKARANADGEKIPIPIITERAGLTVTPGDQQAAVTMELKIRQYAEGWQVLRIRAGNLLVEKIEIDGQPALTGRDPEDATALLLAHAQTGEFTAVVTMSTQLATLGATVRRRFSCRLCRPYN